METLFPTRCVACDAPGEVLCPECAHGLAYIDLKLACPRCGAPFGARLCTECPNPGSEEEREVLEQLAERGLIDGNVRGAQVFPFVGMRAALSYEGGAKSILRLYKDGDELRLDAVIASFICAAMRGRAVSRERLGGAGGGSEGERALDWTQWAQAIVYIPASPEAVLRRGFDHMERVARICGQRTGLPVIQALESRKGALDQRELGRFQRIANRSESFALVDGIGELPRHIILIDDVFTTGATMSAATRALQAGGANEVAAVTCARVW